MTDQTKQKNDCEIRFKVSREHFERLKSEAAGYNLDMPNYMRYLTSALASKDQLPDNSTLAELRSKLAGATNNLNQVAKHLNEDALRQSFPQEHLSKLYSSLGDTQKTVKVLALRLANYLSPMDRVITKSTGSEDE